MTTSPRTIIFPRRYLSIVEQTVGDWIILRRPRADGGNLAYFAAARVATVDTDSDQPGMSYARFADFLAFDQVSRGQLKDDIRRRLFELFRNPKSEFTCEAVPFAP